jgi:hypothetical protein
MGLEVDWSLSKEDSKRSDDTKMSFVVQSVTSLAKEGLYQGLEGENSRESLFWKANTILAEVLDVSLYKKEDKEILAALLAGLVRK